MKQKPIISLEKEKGPSCTICCFFLYKKSFWNPRLGSIKAECRSGTKTTYRWADLASGRLTISSKITGFWQTLFHTRYDNKWSNFKKWTIATQKKILVGATQNTSMSSQQTCLQLHQGQAAASYKCFLAREIFIK